ncbi:MAG TPA: DCC1-like thiol-disulfide oxidoreductase family protein [Mycobacteriales bacterium]|nr:DCC1-like thiol-disulfide oxidoreductase family protein [Mycobacteriales bacterium]
MTRGSAAALLIYDGDCAFCTKTAMDIERHWDGRAGIRAWQQIGASKLADFHLTVEDVSSKVWWIEADGRQLSGHKAVARALIEAGGWRRLLGRIIAARVMSWPAALGYRLAARYRHLLPGGTEACRIDVSQSGR